MEPIKLQDFINEGIDNLRDTLIYKDSGINQMCWVRDNIGFLLGLREECYVYSTHTSKSVSLPVYTYAVESGHKIHIRGNFYDWCVAIDTPEGWKSPLAGLPHWMMKSFITGYYEGMNTVGCDTFCVGSREKMFAILWWLKNEGLILPISMRVANPREM